MIQKIINWFKLRRHFYIIADASDNSMTINQELYKAMDVENAEDIRIFVFRVEDSFGFIINSEETKMIMPTTLPYNTTVSTSQSDLKHLTRQSIECFTTSNYLER